jgi:DNA-binding transcriptional MerR regulator
MATDDENSDEVRVLPHDAAKQLGITKTTLFRYSATGIIKEHRDPKGNRYYLQDDIDEFKERRGGDGTLAVFTAQQSELTSTALDHVRKTLEMVHEPARAILDILKDEVKALRARCSELEKTNSDLITAREAALNEQHVRDLAMKEAQAAIRRKDEVIEILKTVAKPLTAQMIATVGSDAKSAAMADFLGKVDIDKVKMLLAMPFLDDEEKESLKNLLKSFGVEVDISDVDPVDE